MPIWAPTRKDLVFDHVYSRCPSVDKAHAVSRHLWHCHNALFLIGRQGSKCSRRTAASCARLKGSLDYRNYSADCISDHGRAL